VFSLKIGRHAKEPMLLEMQELIGKVTFTGAPQMKSGKASGLLGGPGGVVHSNWELEGYMMKAAQVCKTWNKAYEKYLKTQTGAIFEHVRQDVVSSALDLCDYSKYDDQKPLPNHAQIVHSIYVGGKFLFAMRFKRMKVEGVHELHAFYGVEGKFSALTIPVSPLCCVAERNRDLWQKEFFRVWRAEQSAAVDQWLGEQHAAFRVQEAQGGVRGKPVRCHVVVFHTNEDMVIHLTVEETARIGGMYDKINAHFGAEVTLHQTIKKQEYTLDPNKIAKDGMHFGSSVYVKRVVPVQVERTKDGSWTKYEIPGVLR